MALPQLVGKLAGLAAVLLAVGGGLLFRDFLAVDRP